MIADCLASLLHSREGKLFAADFGVQTVYVAAGSFAEAEAKIAEFSDAYLDGGVELRQIEKVVKLRLDA